jgi:hypothetical protein
MIAGVLPTDGFRARAAAQYLRPLLKVVRNWTQLGHITYVEGGRWGIGITCDDVEVIISAGRFPEHGRWYGIVRTTDGSRLLSIRRFDRRSPGSDELARFLQQLVQASSRA